jgi:hypothetical protein
MQRLQSLRVAHEAGRHSQQKAYLAQRCRAPVGAPLSRLAFKTRSLITLQPAVN